MFAIICHMAGPWTPLEVIIRLIAVSLKRLIRNEWQIIQIVGLERWVLKFTALRVQGRAAGTNQG